MVQTNSHRFNTHVKRLSFSASVVIIIITHLLATSRIVTQYFNHLLLYNFTTSPLKIDEPLSTFQCCHSWLGTFGNWYKCLIVGSFWICVSSDTLQVGERLKLYKEENYAIKSNEYLGWCTLIFLWKRIISKLVNFYKFSLSIHATNIVSTYNVSALIIFPQAFKNFFEVLVHLKCWNGGNYSPSDKRARCITAGKAMKCRMNRAQIRPFHFNDSLSF